MLKILLTMFIGYFMMMMKNLLTLHVFPFPTLPKTQRLSRWLWARWWWNHGGGNATKSHNIRTSAKKSVGWQWCTRGNWCENWFLSLTLVDVFLVLLTSLRTKHKHLWDKWCSKKNGMQSDFWMYITCWCNHQQSLCLSLSENIGRTCGVLYTQNLNLMKLPQSRPVAKIDFGGCRTPQKNRPFEPKKWTFWTSPLNSPNPKKKKKKSIFVPFFG